MVILLYVALGIIFSHLGIRGIFGGDSSEYSFISQIWGIAHPPGYPLYAFLTNVGRILTPFLDEYVRLNLFSIIPGLLAAYFLYRSLYLITKHKFISLSTSLYFLFLYPVWLYLEVPEVFMLNLCLISLITHIVLLIYFKKQFNLFWLLGLILGLSIAHHHTFVFFIPGWAYLLRNRLKGLKDYIITFILFVLLGASVYLYAPIASNFNPPLDIENAKTIGGFFNLFFRTSYGTFKAYNGVSNNIWNQFFNTLSTFVFLLHDYKPAGIVLIIVGLIYLNKKNMIIFKYISILILSYLFFLFLTNFVLSSSFTIATYERFLVAFYYILAFPFAFGLLSVYTHIRKYIIPRMENQYLIRIILFIPIVLTIGLVVINFRQSYQYIRELRNLKAFNIYAMDLLETADKNSIISIQGDTPLFSTAYYYYAKKVRTDLKFVNLALLQRPSYYGTLKLLNPTLAFPPSNDKTTAYFLKDNSEKYAVFSNQPLSIGVWMPYGLLWKYYENDDAASKEAELILKTNENLWKQYTIPTVSSSAKNILYLQTLQNDYLTMYNAYGLILAQRGEYGKAAHVFKNILTQYNQNYTDSATTLIELGFINKADCGKIRPYAEALIKNKEILRKEDLTTILRYLKQCEPKHKLLNDFIRDYKLFLNGDEIPLNKM